MKSMFESRSFWVAALGIIGAVSLYSADAVSQGVAGAIIVKEIIAIVVRRVTSQAATFFPTGK